jgi:hypothetical protein
MKPWYSKGEAWLSQLISPRKKRLNSSKLRKSSNAFGRHVTYVGQQTFVSSLPKPLVVKTLGYSRMVYASTVHFALQVSQNAPERSRMAQEISRKKLGLAPPTLLNVIVWGRQRLGELLPAEPQASLVQRSIKPLVSVESGKKSLRKDCFCIQ